MATRKRDLELEAGSAAHYEDPGYYSFNYRRRQDDVAYYVAHARAVGGRVFEYGIGNGRIALPIARAGGEVAGIDTSAPMLADLRAQLAQEPPEVRKRVRARNADMRAFRGRERFDAVYCAFNTALHLYTRHDVERFLAGARALLAPGAELVLDLSVPVAEDLARDPSRAYRAPRFKHPSAGLVKYEEYFDYDPIRQILFVSMCFEPVSGAEPFTTPLAHSQFYPREWEALLHYNGFEVNALYGDFERGPLTKDSESMVWHVRSAPQRKPRRSTSRS